MALLSLVVLGLAQTAAFGNGIETRGLPDDNWKVRVSLPHIYALEICFDILSCIITRE